MTDSERMIVRRLFAKSAAYSALAAFFRRPEQVDEAWLGTVIKEVPEEDREKFRETFSAIRERGKPYSSVMGGTGVCPDCEIAYRTSTPAGATLADLAGFYRALGFPYATGTDEKPDQISVELNFVSFLFAKEAHAVAGGDGGQADVIRNARLSFLSDHIARWISAFAWTLEQRAADSGFDIAARLAAQIISRETPLDETKFPGAPRPDKYAENAFACGGCAQTETQEGIQI